jgi:hypothetical protein
MTALLVATQDKNVELVRLLLDHGANIEHSTKDGTTALLYDWLVATLLIWHSYYWIIVLTKESSLHHDDLHSLLTTIRRTIVHLASLLLDYGECQHRA